MGRLEVSARIHPTDYHWILVSIQDSSGSGVAGLQPENFKVNYWAITPPPNLTGFGELALEVLSASHGYVGHDPNEAKFYELNVADPLYSNEETVTQGPPRLPLIYMVEVATGSDQGHTLTTSDRWPPDWR
jgi:hypothetical protein